MSQKPLVTIAVSEVTCGKCQHMDVAPQAVTETDGWIQHLAHKHTHKPDAHPMLLRHLYLRYIQSEPRTLLHTKQAHATQEAR